MHRWSTCAHAHAHQAVAAQGGRPQGAGRLSVWRAVQRVQRARQRGQSTPRMEQASEARACHGWSMPGPEHAMAGACQGQSMPRLEHARAIRGQGQSMAGPGHAHPGHAHMPSMHAAHNMRGSSGGTGHVSSWQAARCELRQGYWHFISLFP